MSGLAYTLVDPDEPKRPLGERLRRADSSDWRLWLQKYAWILSLLTMAPGIALVTFTVTENLAFALGVTALAVALPALVFWRRTQGLP